LKLLYLDVFCPSGHLAFNRAYIAKLLAEGFELSYALRAGYHQELGSPPGTLKVEVPAEYYDRPGSLASRLNHWLALRYIRRRIDQKDYDAIFLSSFEEISLWAAGFSLPCILVNHANVAGLDKGLRRWFARRLSRNNTMIVFAEFIRQRVFHHGIKRAQVVPQGLVEPHRPGDQDPQLLSAIDPRLIAPDFRHVVFVPSGAKYADGFIARVTTDPSFQEFLCARSILLVVRGVELPNACTNVVSISKYLSNDEYKALFLASKCLVLHYPESFNYRVSATLIECFSNDKPCVVSDIEGFRAFAHNFQYEPFYGSQAELCAALDRVIDIASAAGSVAYRHLEEQIPSFLLASQDWLPLAEQ
jgi:hypothetical protein